MSFNISTDTTSNLASIILKKYNLTIIPLTYIVDGVETKDFPNPTKLDSAKPVFKKLLGWKCDIRGITEFDKLPKEAQDYVLFVEKELGVHISIVSTGPKRNEIIHR